MNTQSSRRVYPISMAFNATDNRYAVPAGYRNLNEIKAPPPVQNSNSSPYARSASLEDGVNTSGSNPQDRGQRQTDTGQDIDPGASEEDGYDAPRTFANLTEMAPALPVENTYEAPEYRHRSLEEDLGRPEIIQSNIKKQDQASGRRTSKVLTEAITVSYLILFSILGTLARLGLSNLTTYTGAPIVFSNLWPNMAGTLVLGFLSEGAQLFGHPPAKRSIIRPNLEDARLSQSSTRSRELSNESDATATQPSPPPLPVPLHIGLATGFCGSFTTFSGFIEQCFLALSNSAPAPVYHPGAVASKIASRGPGLDFMAVVAVIIVTIATSFAGLKAGAHIAILSRRWHSDKHVPRRLYYWLDRFTVAVTTGVCLGAIFIALFPPDRPSGPLGDGSMAGEKWRGQVLFAVVFAPVGCLVRFYISSRLNDKIDGFPLGTFVVNMLGTLVMAVAWDLQRAPLGPKSAIGGGQLSCQVLEGVINGFCGCLTTVSTWVLELSTIRRRNAHIYGLASMAVGLALSIVIMGTMKWAVGWGQPTCSA